MKTNKIHTIWIIFLTLLSIAKLTSRSIIRQFFGRNTRDWVDRAMYCWSSRVLKMIRVECKVVNPDNIKPKAGQPTIVMCNHSSLYDIPLSFQAFPHSSLRMLAKKELSKLPLMAGGMRAAEFPFIDRKDRRQALEDLKEVSRLLKSGIVMWIAPEGTRSADGKLGPFKKGGFITAIQTQATIIPICIRGASNILPARTWQINMGQSAEIHVGKPVDASLYTLENKNALIKDVRDIMETLL